MGSYGAQLARHVTDTGYRVLEAARPGGADRHGLGKSDPLDARRIAAAVLGLTTEQLRTPGQDQGTPAGTQILLTVRDELTGEPARAVNALSALLRITDLDIEARRPLGTRKIAQAASWRTREEPLAAAPARTEAACLAKPVLELDAELDQNMARISDLVQASPAAERLHKTGIGPVTAARTLVAWSHPGRVHSEAAFAAIAGVNPIPASSGNTTRHRLNRGGDRQLSRALNIIAVVRMVHDPSTRAYVERRRAEDKTGLYDLEGHRSDHHLSPGGPPSHTSHKTDREIRRILKRYLARSIYRHLNTASTPKLGVDGI